MTSTNAYPRLASRLSGLQPSLYARILDRLQDYEGETYPFHIGESYLLPGEAVDAAFKTILRPELHRYGHPQGMLNLRDDLAEHIASQGMAWVGPENIMVTHGATHGLNLACQALLNPGDVMLVTSPHWPLITSMVHAASAVPIEVPFTTRLRSDELSAYQILSRAMHPKAKALYLTSPNNPDGVVLTASELEDVARFCIENDLYILADQAYARFIFKESGSEQIANLEGMRERCITLFTFSKSHRMSGIRVGFVVAPPDLLAGMSKLANISIYNVSLLTQHAARAALSLGETYVRETIDSARTNRNILIKELAELDGIEVMKPAGGAYVFLDLSERLQGRDAFTLLERCLDEGIIFAPGQGFGRSYESYARFCYTAMAPEHLKRGCRTLVKTVNSF